MDFKATIVSLLLMCASTFAHGDDQIPYPGEDTHHLAKRLALVIGIDHYRNAGLMQLQDLPSARTDAEEVGSALKSFGFEVTTMVSNSTNLFLDRTAIIKAVGDFASNAKSARDNTGRGALMLFYFAGHGITIGNDNFILASDFDANSETQARSLGISLTGDVLAQMSGASPELRILMTDACRSGLPPLPLGEGAGAQSVTYGTHELAVQAPGPLEDNRLMYMYATLKGDKAFGKADVGGRFTHSFVSALNKALTRVEHDPQSPQKPTICDIFDRTKDDMETSARSRPQMPLMDDEFASRFYPLTTSADFNLERDAFAKLKMIKPGETNLDKAVSRAYCDAKEMLFSFTRYSYYSREVLGELNRWPDAQPRPKCEDNDLGSATDLNIPSKDKMERWPLPKAGATAVPPAAPPPADGVIHRDGMLENDGATMARVVRISTAQTLPIERQVAQGNVEVPAVSERLSVGAKTPIFLQVREALEKLGMTSEARSALPADSALLQNVVVTKGAVNVRTTPGGDGVLTVVGPGQFLQVLGTDETRTWLAVTTPKIGAGFLDGRNVEPAISQIRKIVGFAPETYELNAESKQELSSTFGLFGGLVILDAVVEYPREEDRIGLARALAVRNFLTEAASADDVRAAELRGVYIGVKPFGTAASEKMPNRAASDDAIPYGSVRIAILGVPLNASTRAAVASVVGSDNRVQLGTTQSGTQGGSVDVRLCGQDAKSCTAPSEYTDALKSQPDTPVRSITKDALSSGSESNATTPRPPQSMTRGGGAPVEEIGKLLPKALFW